MTKTAFVSDVDYARGMVKVTLPDRDDVESDWLSVPSFEYDLPAVNDQVMVSFDENDFKSGLCHGNFYNSEKLPTESGATVYYKTMRKDLVIKYDASSKTLEINAENIVVHGSVTINGDLTVSGDITATGTIMDAAGNSNHHSH